jgi:hypothetical protein
MYGPDAAVGQNLRRLDWLPPFRGEGPMQLKPTQGRWTRVLGMTIMALFWNGILCVFVFHIVRGHLRGEPEWILTIFIIPFVLIGLGLIGAILYGVLAARNPRVMLTVSNDVLGPGGTLDLTWDIPARAARIGKLAIELIAEESATYTRGTDTVTDTRQVYRHTLAEATDPQLIAAGMASATVPGDVMHSFEAANNQVKWSIRVIGRIDRWPDVKDSYRLVILPFDPQQAEAAS